MSIAEAIFAIFGTIVTALTAKATLLWWAYKRGEAAGAEKAGRDAAQAESQARIEQLARELAETHAELATLQSNGDVSLEALAPAPHTGLPNSSLGNDECIDIGLSKSEITVRDIEVPRAAVPGSR